MLLSTSNILISFLSQNIALQPRGFLRRLEAPGCVPGTARILKGALSLPFIFKLIKSQTQPDGGEGYSGKATGYPVTVLGEEAALPRQGTANARGDEQEPS